MQNQPEQLREEVERSIIEREQRRLKQVPKVGQVDLNMDPSGIPLNTVNAERLYQDIRGAFGSSFDDSEIINLIPGEVRERVTPVGLLQLQS